MKINPFKSNFKFQNLFGSNYFRKGCFLIISILFLSIPAFPQENTSKSNPFHFSGLITATNNGVSLIPSFSLGRPAMLFDLSLGGERLSFDPMLRFGMDGKPWSFVFWGRYKIIKDRRFTLGVGAHPAFIFVERQVIVNGNQELMMTTNRFLAGEITTNYKFSERVSAGVYYLRGHGLNPVPPFDSHFLAFNSGFSDLPLVWDFKIKINPQFFLLRVDDETGTYVNSNFLLTKGEFPVGFQAFFNKKLKSDIPGDELVWSVGLVYDFSTKYQKQKD